MNTLDVWQDFLVELKKGSLPPVRFRPYHESLRDALPSVLDNLRPHLLASVDRKTEPRRFTSGNQINFVQAIETGTPGFCFSFLIENGQWYLQHIESIHVRLDQTGAPPVSVFPDLSEETKAWCRDEWRVTEMVRLFHFLAEEKGKAFALDWFRDGEQYFLGVRAWVPFVTPSKAFILYACWEWANLQNNPVTLLELDDTRAVIRAQIRYFEMYKRAMHLPQLISETDYRELFETIWQDRAFHAGWNVQIEYEPEDCVFYFSRESLRS